ncbi:hypothetical protein F2P81_003367 [Scophthalmus maximus]|uniref:Uncharacterized protein n=1 Tax=Scophthalmus maximus TaxID=52904 RepID=A0A6A4TH98_SCOMX|nr:hypothetical protein F2P81_003367 [Scophthalmus maximus]
MSSSPSASSEQLKVAVFRPLVHISGIFSNLDAAGVVSRWRFVNQVTELECKTCVRGQKAAIWSDERKGRCTDLSSTLEGSVSSPSGFCDWDRTRTSRLFTHPMTTTCQKQTLIDGSMSPGSGTAAVHDHISSGSEYG